MRDVKPVTELKDTIEMMESEDYKDRFRAEFSQVNIRREKLKEMLKKWDEGKLPFTPTCPRSMYTEQMRAMTMYCNVLKRRAVLENITLW